MDFSVRMLGSVRGRVFSDTEVTGKSADADSAGIEGVKVTLRSRDPGFENFKFEQFTDASGSYSFQDLRPGKYTVVVDPSTLPANFRLPAVIDSAVTVVPMQNSRGDLPMAVERTVMGIVFIDNDSDGQYKQGKDTPVEGAFITSGGKLAVSDAAGAYNLRNLPAGRVGLLVQWPRKSETTHVVFDLAPGPVANRIVNIPTGR